ncbi:MAG: DUF86 domain-containing protein [Elusimicrobia bacterium]|nr:DUF86 domain-containing protein [Elusimicrobiota bacterium]
MKDDKLYLIHILESIERIEKYTCDGKGKFLSDLKTQDAVLRNLQTLAESTQKLSDSLKSKHSEIDWRALAGFRNVLAHDYLGIDIGQIWDIVHQDIPVLKKKVQGFISF